jgi:hypothetical protein
VTARFYPAVFLTAPRVSASHSKSSENHFENAENHFQHSQNDFQYEEKTMKQVMKIFAVTRRLIPVANAVAAVLALAACRPAVGPAGPGTRSPAGKGVVNIQLGVDNFDILTPASAGRTLLPATPLHFESYTLTFTPAAGKVVVLEDVTALTGIELDEGTYTLDLEAYTGEEPAARGSTSVSVTGGGNTEVTVPLTFMPTEAGTGTLSVTVENTDGLPLAGAEFAWTSLSGGTAAGSENLSGSGSALSGSKILRAGYYVVTVTLSSGEGTAKKGDVAHIGADHTTPLMWTFTGGEFSKAAAPEPAMPYQRFGVYVYDRNPAGVGFFEDWAGLDIKYAEDFLGYDGWQSYTGEWWSDYNPRFWKDWKAANPDKRLILAVSPFPKAGMPGGYDGALSAKARENYQDAADGKFNTYYKQLGEQLKALGLGDTIIRFGHEMSGSWYIYSISVGASEEIRQEKQINYGKAFNEFAKTLTAIPDTDFEFCWNPATDSDPAYLARCYPGDEYVDYIAFDQYDYWLNAYDRNDYHNSTDPAFRRTIQVQAWNQMMNEKWGNPNWFANFAKQHNKPLAIAEWGLWRDNRNSGYDNPYFIEKMYEWINSNDVAWHTYFMFGDVSHSLYDTVTYPLASQKFQELWNPQGSPKVTAAIPPSAVPGYNGPVKRGRDAVFGSNVALVSDPWAWSGGMLAGMWTQNDSWNDNTAITFENCPASSGFALVYQLWHSNLSNSVADNNQRVSLYVNGTLEKSGVTLSHGGRGWGDSYMIARFDGVTVPQGASVMFKADQWNWAWTRLNFDYLVFQKQEGESGTAGITLRASENWKGTLVGGGSASIPRSDGTLAVSVTGGSFTDFVWIVDGVVAAGQSGSSITLAGSDYALGGHSVTVYALDGSNVPWSPSELITFTVTAN